MVIIPEWKETESVTVPIGWRLDYLENLSTTSSGTTPSRSAAERYYENGTFHWVKTMDLTNSDISTTEELVTKAALDETSLRVYPVGTVLVAMYGGFNQIGRTGLLKIPAAVNQAITAIQVNSRLLVSEYLINVLNYRVSYWKTVASSSRKDPNITSHDIKKFPIIFPVNIKEQHAIATALSDIDALIASLDKLIAKKRDIKQATMQQLLTGKTRLPGFSGHGSANLGDFFELNPGRTHHNNTDLVTFIGMEDISESGCIINQNIMPLSSIKKGLTFFERNDVLVAKITPCFENGKGACLDTLETKSGFGSTEFHVLRAKKNAIPRYIFYQTQTMKFRKQLETEMIGTAGQKRVPAKAIIQYSLPVLHLKDEQQAIATVLSDMDAEIAALEHKREKTYMLKQGMMQELLTGKTRLL